MAGTTIGLLDERMLKLVARGATSREIAEKLGYQHGTIRVYLHQLYRKLKVANKTAAAAWYLDRAHRQPEGAGADEPAVPVATGDPFAEMALEEDLYAALGVLSRLIGPYSAIWEVGARLKGTPLDSEKRARRARSRELWHALLKGDFALGKRAYDANVGAELLLDAPSDAVTLVCLLLLGGYSSAADRMIVRLRTGRKAASGTTLREGNLVRELRDAMQPDDQGALPGLHKLASEKPGASLIGQVAMVVLFHVHRARRDLVRARKAAAAILAEAESARKQLEAMGEWPSRGTDLRPPSGAQSRVKRPAREMAAAGR